MDLRNIVLIGMPGSGKSTIGSSLAERLQCDLIDTDWLMMDTYGKNLPSLIAAEGIDGFIRLEGLVGEALRCEGCVIATGGSMVFSERAMANLSSSGVVVWLDTPLEELKQRLAFGSDRGIAAEPGVTVEHLDSVRRPLYARYADVCVPSLGGKRDVALRIEQALRARGDLA